MTNKSGNKFLAALSRKITKEGIKIEIAGETVYVVNVDISANSSLLLEAERQAKRNLSDDAKELIAQKLTKAEKADAIGGFSAIDAGGSKEVIEYINSLKTRYDLEVYIERTRIYGGYYMIECLRDSDGKKLYNNKEERNQMIDLILSIEGMRERILEAIQSAQKKSNPIQKN